ncbi:PAS domain S-box protein [bacterium]|nr:PAS domain S-box protein [bacterium]
MTDPLTPPGDASPSPTPAEKLRREAEAIQLERTAGAPEPATESSPHEMRRLLHELQVHQIELEMQNEELRRGQWEIEAARARYFDLYDLAPVGYLTLDEQGKILESNYAASRLLGLSRRGLVQQSITRFIRPEEQDTYYLQCRRLLDSGLPQVSEIRMMGRDREEFWARLEAASSRTADGVAEIRIILSEVTERKQAEAALRDSVEFSSSLIRYMQDGFSVLDLDGVTLDANPAFCRMTGFSREQLVGSAPPLPYWPPEELGRIQAAHDETLSGNSRSNYELIFMRQNGERFPVIISPFAVKNQLGETINYSATVKDITERKQAELALAESAAFQKDVLNSLPAHIAVLDQEGKILAVNEPWLEFGRRNGVSSAEAIGVGTNYLDMCRPALHQDDPYARQAIEGLHNVLSGQIPRFALEYPCATPSGCSWSAMEILKPTGRGIGAIISHTDITERKAVEEALHNAAQKLKLHFEQTPMAVIEWDLDFRVTQWNPAARTIFGYTREEALGQPASFIVPPEYRHQMDQVGQALLQRSGGERSSNPNVSKDGTPILCEWYNTALIDEDGTVAGAASIVMDITESSQAQQLLAWEKGAMEMIGSVIPLHEVLDELMLSLEHELPGSLCSVLLLDADGIRIRQGSSPSLPPSFNREMVGLPMGSGGSADFAASEEHQVIVSDIASDPRWAGYRELAASHDLSSCWSTPIHGSEDRVLGTLAIYYRQPRRPAAVELELIERAVHVVRIAIKRKQAEEALRESEQKYRTLFENASDAIILMHDNTILDCNRQTLEIFKCSSQEQMVGHSPHEFSPPVQPDGRPSVETAIELGIATRAGQPQFFEWLHLRRDGSSFPAEVSLNTVELGGKLVLQAIVRDISQRKLAEEEIRSLNAGLEQRVRERTRELQTANASLSDFKAALDEHAIVGITDRRGKITYANGKFCAISQYSRDELVGNDHRLVSSAYYSKAFIRDLWLTISRGRVWKGEIKDRAKDGSFYWLTTTIVPFLDDDGKVTQFIFIRTDITEHKRAEEEIHKLNADLQTRAAQLAEANKELEAFTYSVSHDLRAPLRAVDGFSRMVLEDYSPQLDADGQRMLGVIRSETQRMGRLIDDLLAFSRLGRLPIQLEPIDMRAMAQLVFDEQAAHEPSRKLRLVLQPLPPACGSEALIRQVWVNLISNAIKFTQDRETGEIEIGSCQDLQGGQIYYVKDNGTGFDMRHAEKLFGVFQRLHTQQQFSGTGVGLALVQRIVQRHAGRVWAVSSPDQGSTFSFLLPACHA